MRKLLPGTWVTICNDGRCLKCGDVGKIFSIEKGTDPFRYAIYSYKKDAWEFFHAVDLI